MKRIPCLQDVLAKPKLCCGQCSGLSKERLVNEKVPCLDLGVIATSAVCNKFKPDIDELISDVDSLEPLLALSKLLAKVKTKNLDTLSALIQAEKTTRKQNMRFGQRVYIRYRGQANANYASNFMIGFIMDAGKNYVRVRSRDGAITMTFAHKTDLEGPAVYSKEAFEPIREKMYRNEKLIDPDVRVFAAKRIQCMEDYKLGISQQSQRGEIPTIDTVFKESGYKKDKKKVNDLTDIVRDIERGFSAKEKAKNYRVDTVKDKKGKKTKSKMKVEVTTTKTGTIEKIELS